MTLTVRNILLAFLIATLSGVSYGRPSAKNQAKRALTILDSYRGSLATSHLESEDSRHDSKLFYLWFDLSNIGSEESLERATFGLTMSRMMYAGTIHLYKGEDPLPESDPIREFIDATWFDLLHKSHDKESSADYSPSLLVLYLKVPIHYSPIFEGPCVMPVTNVSGKYS